MDQLTMFTEQQRETHDRLLRTFRCLVADLCQNFNSGHPGGAMSMASIGIALYKYAMKYSPENPRYLNRDRLVLSNGHTCLWHYIYMHFTGYPNMSMDQLKTYRSPNLNSLCPGHSQIQHDGHEVTTGPIGEGVAQAIGLAAASKHLAATYNRPGYEIFDNMTWCTIGDGCLQEGVAQEAMQLAGHWKLDNLAILYDNNSVTCDGSLDLTCTDDVNAKMTACGWHVVDVFDGISNVEDITRAMHKARIQTEKPTFINIRTVLAFGIPSKEGRAEGHGDPLAADDVVSLKRQFGFDPAEFFRVDPEIYSFFEDRRWKGRELEKEFEQKLQAYAQDFPDSSKELVARLNGQMLQDWREFIPPKSDFLVGDHATRESAALIVAALARNINSFVVGTANLALVVDFTWKGHACFQHPGLTTDCGISGDYDGRYIHFGIREHAMASISNGMAAFNTRTIIPMTAAFNMFYLYAAPGVRLGAIQGLQAIHLATHDSIAPGIDGPAHQPIEVAALFRAMPNLLYIRPCDSEETCGAFAVALSAETTPTVLSLSRHPLPQYPQHSKRDGVEKGAYVFLERDAAELTFISTGAEIKYAVEAAERLEQDRITARIVSCPCSRLFDIQTAEYRESVMQFSRDIPIIVIEAYAVNGWERYADAGYSMNSFGKSLPENLPIYNFFGFSAETIAVKVKAFLMEVRGCGLRAFRGNFKELNGGPMSYGWNPL